VTSIAIVGAGPQLGLAIARTFGSHGFDVALISRNRDKLDTLVGKLAADGINAAAFPADVLDRDALTRALKDAATRFGGIDVLEYSPVGTFGTTVLTSPTGTEPAHVEFEMNFQLYGAIAATQAVLPAMREAGAGTLLFTTGAGSIVPDPRVANVNAAAAALRNWAMNLHRELADAGTGVQAAHVGIDVSIGTAVIPGLPTAQPEQIAPVYCRRPGRADPARNEGSSRSRSGTGTSPRRFGGSVVLQLPGGGRAARGGGPGGEQTQRLFGRGARFGAVNGEDVRGPVGQGQRQLVVVGRRRPHARSARISPRRATRAGRWRCGRSSNTTSRFTGPVVNRYRPARNARTGSGPT
jgi:NAD(P)-dependent dehydrogenase (short-subunit alcohol dehydrogenase family)